MLQEGRFMNYKQKLTLIKRNIDTIFILWSYSQLQALITSGVILSQGPLIEDSSHGLIWELSTLCTQTTSRQFQILRKLSTRIPNPCLVQVQLGTSCVRYSINIIHYSINIISIYSLFMFSTESFVNFLLWFVFVPHFLTDFAV